MTHRADHHGQTRRGIWLDRDLDASLVERMRVSGTTATQELRAALVAHLATPAPVAPARPRRPSAWAARAGLPRRSP
jgi:hypothetical protein